MELILGNAVLALVPCGLMVIFIYKVKCLKKRIETLETRGACFSLENNRVEVWGDGTVKVTPMPE